MQKRWNVVVAVLMLGACKPKPSEAPAPDPPVQTTVQITVQTAEQATEQTAMQRSNETEATTPTAAEARTLAEGDVREVLDAWLAAQNAGDFDMYEALYDSPFRGVKRVGDRAERFDRAGWLADRKRMFDKPIEITANAVSIRLTDGGASVRFVQTWSSGEYSDTGPKELTLEQTDDGLRITSEVMLRSTVGSSGVRVERPPATDFETLLASAQIVAISSDDILFDPRRDGACGDWEDCDDDWLRLDVEASGFTRKSLTPAEAGEYLGFLGDPASYGEPPAACYVPRLIVAFYHADEVIPWATVGVCIECATLGTWPAVTEIGAAMPEAMSGLGALDNLTSWCERVGLTECVDDVPYYDAY